MGVFMASVAFRRTEKTEWEVVKPQIEAMFKGLDGLTDNLDSEGPGYAIVSPYGDMGMFLADFPAKISAMTGDYAVMASCCDSDFDLLELYHNGKLVEKSVLGECYEEFEDLEDCAQPDAANWIPLLTGPEAVEELKQALGEVEVFAEDNLRLLSKVTGLPIFDDELVFAED